MNNILIPFANAIDPTSGGVERVYHNLVPSLRKMGCNVYATYHIKSQYDTSSVYNAIYYLGNGEKCDKKIKEQWLQIIKQRNINIIICPFSNHKYYDFFSKQKQLKVFFHIHNVPSVYHYPSVSAIPNCLKNTVVDHLLKRLRFVVRYKKSFDRIKRNGMKVILLSERFRMDINSFCSLGDDNLKAIPNPIIFDENFDLKANHKDKTILYVGRVTTRQKRFQSLLNIWKKLQYLLPEYNLEIVGGGPEKDYYVDKAKEMNLSRITFHGFQSPEQYYKKAQVFCMVSNYEGFSMVLVEAMQYGCVPFAFDSFAALPDIIDDGINGYRIPPFNEEIYVQRIVDFIKKTREEKEKIYNASMSKAKLFSVENIAKEWIRLFDNYKLA